MLPLFERRVIGSAVVGAAAAAAAFGPLHVVLALLHEIGDDLIDSAALLR